MNLEDAKIKSNEKWVAIREKYKELIWNDIFSKCGFCEFTNEKLGEDSKFNLCDHCIESIRSICTKMQIYFHGQANSTDEIINDIFITIQNVKGGE